MKEKIKNHIKECGFVYLFLFIIFFICFSIVAITFQSVVDIDSRHHLTLENNELKNTNHLLAKENETLKEIIKLMRDES